MKKFISIIILSSLLFLSCSKDDDNSMKFEKLTVNSIDYHFNMPSLSNDYNASKANLEKVFTSVTLEKDGDNIIINASQPKGENNLFTSITATYHSNFYGFISSNMAFTYAVKNIDSQSYIKIKKLMKEQSTPVTK